MCMRVENHVVLDTAPSGRLVTIINRYTVKKQEPRGLFCGIGQCTDCAMIVDGKPNVRTCITPVRAGMGIETQNGLGKAGA